MRAIIQRVTKASVEVDGNIVSSIGRGLCVLVGISRDDTPQDADWMLNKLLSLRIFDDDTGKRWCTSVKDKNFEILCVSQFTLYHTLKGNKPDFHHAMGGDNSKEFYGQFLEKLKKTYNPNLVKDGVFGALMQVNIVNDGPVTLTLESPQHVKEAPLKNRENSNRSQKSDPSTTNSSGRDPGVNP